MGYEPLGYMGDLASEDATTNGHNVGKPSPKAAASTTIAGRGYRKLPGSASQPPPVPLESPFGGPPLSAADLRMSVEHHKDSIAFEARHLRDHNAGLAKAERVGDGASAAYHRQHRDEHTKQREEHVTELSKRQAQLRAKR